MDLAPIFVHSLFRAGSTYIFGVFRRSPAGYWCYQEPLHEHLHHATTAPERLLDIDFAVGSALRHPRLDKPYFWEFHEVKNTVASLFRKELSYDWFFAAEGQPSLLLTARYLQALLDAARGRPMFQCCRTFGRAAALKRRFGGVHIHLWRNPWDQWWSYQVENYFEATDQLILNAVDLPPVLRAVRERCAICDFHNADVETEFAHASDHRLNARSAYLAFYALWLYAFVELEAVAELSVNIDLLSASAAYRRRTLGSLRAAGITDIDFSDCRIAQAGFGARDRTFFEDAEDDVHRLFEQHGYPATTLDSALRLRGACRPAPPRAGQRLIDDADRAREAARRQIDQTAHAQLDRTAQATALRNAQEFAAALERGFIDRANQLSAQIETRASELADAQRELEARAGALEHAQTAAAAMTAELAQRHQEISKLKGDTAAMRLELDVAGTRVQLQQQALLSTRDYAANLENEISAARSRIDELHREMTHWSNVANDTYNHLQAVYATRSWRITAPLRWIKRIVRVSRLASNGSWTGLIRRAQSSATQLVAHTARYLHTRPALKRILIRMLARFPRHYQKIRSIAFSHAIPHPVAPVTLENRPMQEGSNPGGTHDSSDFDRCSPSVLRIYRLLVSARDTATSSPMESPRGMSSN